MKDYEKEMLIMKKITLSQLFEHGCENAKYFKGIGDPIAGAMSKVAESALDKKIIEDGSFLMSVGMAMGARVTRNQYIATGLVIGTIGTLGVTKLISDYKTKKDEE